MVCKQKLNDILSGVCVWFGVILSVFFGVVWGQEV